jgi:hypothetical protein
MRVCGRVALALMAVSASLGVVACGPVDDLKASVSRLLDVVKSPGGPQGVFADDVSDATPVPPSEQPSKMQARKAKKDKTPPSKVQRPQTAEKKPPTSDFTQTAKPQRAETQPPPSQPEPSRLRTQWPEAPPAGTFAR